MIVYVFKRNDDYKSIALPAELQGHNCCHTTGEFVIIKDYYNACNLSLLLAQDG